MGYKIEIIEGIGGTYGAKPETAGVKTTDDLLEKCGGKSGRKSMAATTGISEKLILSWANMADLMRLKGVGGEFAELMHGSGVDTIKELRQRNSENLSAKMGEVNAEKKLTRVVPSATSVQGWIDEAKGMEPRITH